MKVACLQTFASCLQTFQQDMREELASLNPGACKTYDQADMTPQQMSVLQHELQRKGLHFEVTGQGDSQRIEVKAPILTANMSTSQAEGAEPVKQFLPAIESPTPRRAYRIASDITDTEEMCDEYRDALGGKAFEKFAFGTIGFESVPDSAQKVFRKADLAALVEQLRSSAKTDKSDWPRRRFIKSINCFERLFDEALELQIDLKGHSSAGLTRDFFQVYIHMCGQKLGWSSSSLLFALLGDPERF
jgi:hypothetical protein